MAVSKAKEAQDKEPAFAYANPEEKGPFYSIDVECVATGSGHSTSPNHRIPGRIALLDSDGNTLLDAHVKFGPDQNIVSYLTPLTGCTAEISEGEEAQSLEDIVKLIKDKIPKDAVIVGQSIKHDMEWLGLKQQEDYSDAVDIAEIFRHRVPKNVQEAAAYLREKSSDKENTNASSESSTIQEPKSNEEQPPPHKDEYLGFETKYRIFSLRHVCINLLDEDPQQSHHDPTLDAKYSLVLFHKYRSAPAAQLRAIRDSLHRAPITNSFSYDCPLIDGVCMSINSYKYKWAGRFIWKWYSALRCKKET